MKNRYYLILAFALGLSWQASAQNFALVEHFTNTHCPICTNKNPQLFQVIADNSPNVHHIAYHPPYPYSACIFYQANVDGNQNRADYYNVPGSPTAYIGGVRGNGGSQLLSDDKIKAAITRPVMVEMTVEESEVSTLRNAVEREVRINIKTIQAPEAGSHKLYAAVVEKEIAYNSPNGESIHHDVFRKMLPENGGMAFTFPAVGEETEIVLNFEYESGWQQDEIYVVVFIQDDENKSILGSATKFDQTTTSNKYIPEGPSFKIRNNPATHKVMIVLEKGLDSRSLLNIRNLNGQVIESFYLAPGKRLHDIDVNALAQGMYILEINQDNTTLTKKFIKK